MTIATGIAKQLVYKKETVFGADPSAGSAQVLRRVTSDIDLSKATYESAEIRADYQVADMRHGVRSVGGTVRGEFSPTTFRDFIAAALRAPWTTPGTGIVAAATVSSTAGALGVQKVSDSGTGFITAGHKVGDIVAMTGWTTTMAGNNTRNYVILSVTAGDMLLAELQQTSAPTLVTKAAGDPVTISAHGWKCFVPLTGHTNDSFTIEHNYVDIAQSERFNGCRVAGIDIGLPATGMASFDVRVMGQNMQTGTSGYFTTPTAATTTGDMAAVNGKLVYNDAVSALITAASIRIDSGMTVGAVVGSNVTPDVFVGRVRVTGQLSAYFQDGNIRDDFLNENTPSLSIALATANGLNSDFVSITCPKIKLGGATKSDGEQGLVLTAPFTALLSSTVVGENQSTIIFQDSTITS